MTGLDDLLKDTLEFTAQKGWTGSSGGFFHSLVLFLGEKLGVEYALVDELLPGQKRARTVGLFASGEVVPDVEYDLRGTPCENVMGQSLCCYPRGIQALFPEDVMLQQMGAESYLGLPLWDSQGNPIGLIAVMGQAPLENREAAESILQIVAIRCAHELERKRYEEERRRIESELHHFQKLESVGRLASGVAHDMNNVLAAIMGLATVLRDRLEGDALGVGHLDLILNSADRGRALVRGLTAFARAQLEDAVPLDFNALIRQEAELLRQTTFRKVDLELDLEESLPPVMGEASALGNVLMNLCVNAVDAMPEGGKLTFRSRENPKGFVEISIVDTGQGMSPQVLARAMDPFFTTKPPGKGTGLGLSIVFGAMKAHGGTVGIQSAEGTGTAVLLRFPALAHEAGQVEAEAELTAAPEVPLTILLVDDEPMILESSSELLRHFGHRVVVARGGQESLDRLEAGLEVDLVILDQNMPGLNGIDTLRCLRATQPELPVILCSGQVDLGLQATLGAFPRTTLLEKPFRAPELQAAIRKAQQQAQH